LEKEKFFRGKNVLLKNVQKSSRKGDDFSFETGEKKSEMIGGVEKKKVAEKGGGRFPLLYQQV